MAGFSFCKKEVLAYAKTSFDICKNKKAAYAAFLFLRF